MQWAIWKLFTESEIKKNRFAFVGPGNSPSRRYGNDDSNTRGVVCARRRARGRYPIQISVGPYLQLSGSQIITYDSSPAEKNVGVPNVGALCEARRPTSSRNSRRAKRKTFASGEECFVTERVGDNGDDEFAGIRNFRLQKSVENRNDTTASQFSSDGSDEYWKKVFGR